MVFLQGNLRRIMKINKYWQDNVEVRYITVDVWATRNATGTVTSFNLKPDEPRTWLRARQLAQKSKIANKSQLDTWLSKNAQIPKLILQSIEEGKNLLQIKSMYSLREQTEHWVVAKFNCQELGVTNVVGIRPLLPWGALRAIVTNHAASVNCFQADLLIR